MLYRRPAASIVLFSVLMLSACSGGGEAEQPLDASTQDVTGDVDRDAGDVTDAGEQPQLVDAERAFELVDPFIGTGGLGFGYAALTPAAQMPNGLVKLGPDTSKSGSHGELNHFSGYHYDDPDTRGFSHLHLVGTGAAGLGNLRVLPVAQVDADTPWEQYTTMDKASEAAEPGYYTVELPDAGVTAELTASLRGGFHKYTSADGGLTLLFDPAGAVKTSVNTSVDMTVDGSTIEGSVVYSGDFATRSGPFTLHFSATMDPAPSNVSAWNDDGVQDGQTIAQGSQGGAVLTFDEASEVELRVGLSLVDMDQARLHRTDELGGRSFDEVREAAKQAWLDKLGRVRIKGGSLENQTVFYTALYNVWRMPTRLDGADGRYRGVDDEVYRADGFKYYSDLSLWDTFRTLHPWLVLVDPELQRDCLNSLLAMKDASGYIPRWPAMQTFTGSMIGTPADFVFAESALKGIEGVDYDAAFDALYTTATEKPPEGAMFRGRTGVERYVQLGYLPADEFDESVSRTLEFSWSDWALANLADHLGRSEASELRDRSENWKNLFNPQGAFFAPKNADGTFEPVGGSTFGREGPYTEGNAWHYRFYPIWHPEAFAETFGGQESFFTPLSAFFEDSKLEGGGFQTVLPDQRYWHGNEHDLGAVYLFHYAGRSDQVGRWSRAIQTTAYTTEPDGLPGNDDGGTLSAWYLFSALGFSPVAGGDGYMLGSPLFPYAEVDVANGETLVIEADGAAVDVPYVDDVSVDGEPAQGATLTHEQLMGATLTFEMAAD